MYKMDLIDIIHVRTITGHIAQAKLMSDIFTDEQKIKLATIESLIGEIGIPTTDEELDETINTLTEIRDK